MVCAPDLECILNGSVLQARQHYRTRSSSDPSALRRHLGSVYSPQDPSVGAPPPTQYGIDSSCTFNSNDPCVADARTSNTSVDIVERGVAFITQATADGLPFYVNIWLHVSHDRLDPSEAQKAAVRGSAKCTARNLATNQSQCATEIFVAAQQDADVQIGAMSQALGELDLHESTLILFSTGEQRLMMT